MTGSANERARGRWRAILRQLGIPDRYLTGKHTPCPVCPNGGRDRFRFTDYNGDGLFFCSVHGQGTPIDLLVQYFGWTYKESLDEVERIVGNTPMTATPSQDQATKQEQNGRKITQVWSELSQDRSDVQDYLLSRGLEVDRPSILHEHPRLPLYDEDGQLVDYYPAMVAPFHDANGYGASLHRTYIGPVPDRAARKKVMPPYRPIKGGAIRLFDHRHLTHLAVAEGIETALAVYELFQIPCWALYSAQNMEVWMPPDGIQGVSIFADNDLSCTGQKVAYSLAFKLYQRGYQTDATSVHVPPRPGMDWLDVLVAKKRNEVQAVKSLAEVYEKMPNVGGVLDTFREAGMHGTLVSAYDEETGYGYGEENAVPEGTNGDPN